MKDVVVVRPMTRGELDRVVGWAAAEGWNPGLHDATPFWTADPAGFVVAERGGEPVGAGSVVSYEGRFGFMGLFIVLPEHRKHRVGDAIWHAGCRLMEERLLPGAAAGMDGVEAMVPFYARGGFRLSHLDRRFAFTGSDTVRPEGLVPALSVPFADLAAYDAGHFSVPRQAFLASWLSQPDVVSLAAVEGSRIAGYGVLRRCRTGRKVGPLFARDAAVAGSLLLGLSAAAPGEPLFLDVPETNPAAMALARGQGMREVFSCARMYKGKPPVLPEREIFGVTSFELG